MVYSDKVWPHHVRSGWPKISAKFRTAKSGCADGPAGFVVGPLTDNPIWTLGCIMHELLYASAVTHRTTGWHKVSTFFNGVLQFITFSAFPLVAFEFFMVLSKLCFSRVTRPLLHGELVSSILRVKKKKKLKSWVQHNNTNIYCSWCVSWRARHGKKDTLKSWKKKNQCLLIGPLMEELNKSIVDVPLSCGGSELPQHVLCLAKHRTGNSAGQIGCLSPANSYWQKETNSHFYSHPQAILSFFHLTCVSLDCGRKTTGAPENTFRQTENTQTPKRRQIVTRIFMKCVILSRFITLFLHQNNFLELIWLVDCFFFFFLSLSQKNMWWDLC